MFINRLVKKKLLMKFKRKNTVLFFDMFFFYIV